MQSLCLSLQWKTCSWAERSCDDDDDYDDGDECYLLLAS